MVVCLINSNKARTIRGTTSQRHGQLESISCLDYCNAWYMGLSLKRIQKLQLVQNVAAWVVKGVGYLTHVTLHELHCVSRYNLRYCLSSLKSSMAFT